MVGLANFTDWMNRTVSVYRQGGGLVASETVVVSGKTAMLTGESGTLRLDGNMGLVVEPYRTTLYGEYADFTDVLPNDVVVDDRGKRYTVLSIFNPAEADEFLRMELQEEGALVGDGS